MIKIKKLLTSFILIITITSNIFITYATEITISESLIEEPIDLSIIEENIMKDEENVTFTDEDSFFENNSTEYSIIEETNIKESILENNIFYNDFIQEGNIEFLNQIYGNETNLILDNFEDTIYEEGITEYIEDNIINNIVLTFSNFRINPVILNLQDYNPNNLIAPSHSCIYDTKYNDLQHWTECKICHKIQGKSNHNKSDNGGSKTLSTNYSSSAYRNTCSCGWQSKPLIYIQGNYNNYSNGGTLNTNYLEGWKLSDIMQITYSDFLSINYPNTVNGKSYTWYDDDGDGYGWVFNNGLVVGDGVNTIGTLRLILGNKDIRVGRGNEVDEIYTIIKYLISDTSPTLSEFINSLSSKDTLNSQGRQDHLIYGLKEKYQTISNNEWNEIVSVLKGYTIHSEGWGYSGTHSIQCSTYISSGNIIYYSSPYDSSKHINCTFDNGISTICDVCNHYKSGNEAFLLNNWYCCILGCYLEDGQTATCGGHKVIGLGNTYLGTVYCTFSRNGSTILRTKVTAVPATGFTYSINNTSTNLKLNLSDADIIRSYTYIGTVTFSNGTISRTISCGYYYPLIDMTAPIAYNYTNDVTNNNYWSVTGNGTATKTSGQASVKVTFYDAKDYSFNTLKVRVYDSDRKTIIPQGNGDTFVPLTNVSGNNTLWTGTINIPTEIKGSKDIYIQAIDQTGHQSILYPMQISYLDSTGPILNISLDNTDWAKQKILTVSATDAFDIAYVGISANDMVEVTSSSYGGSRQYTLVGDVHNYKTITLYANDSFGNLTYKTFNIGKLDNTAPTITNITQTSGIEAETFYIIANDINSSLNENGSGVTEYGYKRKGDTSIQWKSSNTFTFEKSGTYELYAKDLVGNISEPRIVNVNILIDKTSSISWNDKNNSDGFRPKEYILKLEQNGVVLKEIILPSTQNSYTFENLPKYDSEGNLYDYAFAIDATDRYQTSFDENGNVIINDYVPSNFSVTIPKTIILDGTTGTSSYDVTVNGTFYYNDTLTIEPTSSFTMYDKLHIQTIKGKIEQEKIEFKVSDNVNIGTTTEGYIHLEETKFAGEYKGSFNFNIKFKLSN